jgi:hypothetical protein
MALLGGTATWLLARAAAMTPVIGFLRSHRLNALRTS